MTNRRIPHFDEIDWPGLASSFWKWLEIVFKYISWMFVLAALRYAGEVTGSKSLLIFSVLLGGGLMIALCLFSLSVVYSSKGSWAPVFAVAKLTLFILLLAFMFHIQADGLNGIIDRLVASRYSETR